MCRYIFACLATLAMISPAASALETRWIPAAASNPGLHGTFWSTDLWLHSQVIDTELVVTATFFAEQLGTAEPEQATITLPPYAPVEITDAVATLFGENRPGSIRLEAQYPFFAQSRTSNTGGESGSYGQGIPAFTTQDTSEGYTLLGAANRPGADGTRTNLGIANTSSATQTVLVIARDPDTLEEIGSASVEIGPYGWFQDDLFEILGAGDQNIELADVSVFPAAFNMVYISRVDNRSGDGTFIYGSSGPSVRAAGGEPRWLWVRAILTYDEGVTLDWFKFWGPNGWYWARYPSSGYTTDPVQVQLPMNYCVKAIGQAGAILTMVRVSIQEKDQDGNWVGGRVGYGTNSRNAIDQEFCKQLD